ncbi:hypothetical protein [Neptuniibacter sp.]|uniref:hypothetical protein n=1 Tax=Neptuniibacter sp. TaxID=1962643 RepID=UPI0026229CD3|nr:hypothetical protein [Neptuniibacter sp.]
MVVSLNDQVTTRRLVLATNNLIGYEDMGGSLLEVTGSSGDIDTTDQLQMFGGFQKAFVVNGANLKVVDLVNTKLTSEAQITSNIPAHGDILTQDTTNAQMVVDYIFYDVGTSDHYVYGFTTSGTFNTSNDVKDADANVIITSGNLSAVDEATTMPHWYDWTPYNDDTTTYGTMPEKAYLATLYRGRPVLSGNPNAPFQWYMGRQNNPWDWAYVAGDAQSPVAGGNADAGEIGDIVRALISYKDDYLIFGCASSIWYLSGDATFGGSLNELSLTTGIFGAQSWCWDDGGNLWWWGKNGIYKSTIPQMPVNVSAIDLPKLVKDEAANPSTHRITMAFDRDRQGILITITKLSDGTHSNYWYSLRTEGFFPESYPTACGPYSLLYYDANDTDDAGLLVGCKDGYVREFVDSAKDDDIGGSDQAIDSYVGLGPFAIGGSSKNGKITGLNPVTAGGGTGGSQSDSDDIDYKVFTDIAAEKVIERLVANVTPNFAGTIKSPGRQRGGTKRQKARGAFAAIRLGNSGSGETWGFEKIDVGVSPTGRIK